MTTLYSLVVLERCRLSSGNGTEVVSTFTSLALQLIAGAPIPRVFWLRLVILAIIEMIVYKYSFNVISFALNSLKYQFLKVSVD